MCLRLKMFLRHCQDNIIDFDFELWVNRDTFLNVWLSVTDDWCTLTSVVLCVLHFTNLHLPGFGGEGSQRDALVGKEITCESWGGASHLDLTVKEWKESVAECIGLTALVRDWRTIVVTVGIAETGCAIVSTEAIRSTPALDYPDTYFVGDDVSTWT